MLVYLDANIVVYLIEQPPNFGPRAAARIQSLVAAGDRILVSELVRVECRSTPLANGDHAALSQYDAFFAHVVEQVAPLSRAVCDRATLIVDRTDTERRTRSTSRPQWNSDATYS